MNRKDTRTLPPQKLHINLQLQGDEVIRFLEYKEGQFLRNNSEAGRKLLLERLHEVEPAPEAEAAGTR